MTTNTNISTKGLAILGAAYSLLAVAEFSALPYTPLLGDVQVIAKVILVAAGVGSSGMAIVYFALALRVKMIMIMLGVLAMTAAGIIFGLGLLLGVGAPWSATIAIIPLATYTLMLTVMPRKSVTKKRENADE